MFTAMVNGWTVVRANEKIRKLRSIAFLLVFFFCADSWLSRVSSLRVSAVPPYHSSLIDAFSPSFQLFSRWSFTIKCQSCDESKCVAWETVATSPLGIFRSYTATIWRRINFQVLVVWTSLAVECWIGTLKVADTPPRKVLLVLFQPTTTFVDHFTDEILTTERVIVFSCLQNKANYVINNRFSAAALSL